MSTDDQESRSAWQDAIDQGVDVSLIEANLRKSPEERIRAHCRAWRTARRLRKAVQQAHGLS